MKILFVTEFFPSGPDLKFTGGVETRTFFTAKNLAKKDKVLVICRKTTTFTDVQTPEVCVYRCGLPVKNVEANFFSVFERIIFIFGAILKGLKLDFDLIEGSNFVTYLPAFFLGFLKKKPAIAWYADVFKGRWIGMFGVLGFFGEITERISLKLSWTKIIALSMATKNKLIKEGIAKEKIEIIYGGVDYRKLKIKNEKLKMKKRNIICISRLVSYKRVEDLIIAFLGLIKKGYDLSLIIVGQGPEETKLKELVQVNKLGPKVRFLKNLEREKLLDLLTKSYIFCLPSITEGFGLATIEAACCQTPYVVADIDVNREITGNGQGGLLFKKENSKDLQEKIDILLRNQDIYKKKQQECLTLAARYDWEKIINQTSKIFHQAIDKQD